MKVAGKCRPISLDAVTLAMLGAVLFENGPFERRNRLTLANDVQRHALAHFAFGVAVSDHGLVAVRVRVDVTRCDHAAFRRNSALAGCGMNLTDAGDFAIFDSHIAVEPGIPRAVDQSAAVNDDVELGHAALLFLSLLVPISPR
jgi:hypothetical protein